MCNAAGLGLQRRDSPPEGDVLALDDPAALHTNNDIFLRNRMKHEAVHVSFPPRRRTQ